MGQEFRPFLGGMTNVKYAQIVNMYRLVHFE